MKKLERFEEEQPPYFPERKEDIVACCASCEHSFVGYDCEWYCGNKEYKVRSKFKPQSFYRTHIQTEPYYICGDFDFQKYILKEMEIFE